MKHTLLIKVALCAAIMLTSTGANAPSKDFKKLAKIEGVEHVHVGKFLLNLAARAKLKKDVQDILARDKYEVLMQIREDGDKVDIYHCVGKQQSVVVMLMDEDDNATVMIFSGHFTLDDVMKMTK